MPTRRWTSAWRAAAALLARLEPEMELVRAVAADTIAS
jgi:hypothetical protein